MITLSQEIIGYINVFEKATGASVKDCFIEDGTVVFVVNQGNIGLAIGKGGRNIKHVSSLLRKKINVIEFNPDPITFIKNLLSPIAPKEVKIQDSTIVIMPHDVREKGKIYGRDRTNFKKLQEIIYKYFRLNLKLE